MPHIKTLCIALALYLLIPAPAHAQNTKLNEMLDNPYKEKVRLEAAALKEQLNEEEINNLALIRRGFGTIRTVQLVRKEVHDAVALCGKNVPEAGPKVTAQFNDWQDTIQPLLDRNKRLLEASITEGFFRNPEAVRSFLETVDQAALFENGKNPTTPKATPSSCKKLTKTLHETEHRLANILRDVEWPKPKIVFQPHQKPATPVSHSQSNENFEKAEKDALQ